MAHELVIERKFLKNSKSLAPSGKTGAWWHHRARGGRRDPRSLFRIDILQLHTTSRAQAMPLGDVSTGPSALSWPGPTQHWPTAARAFRIC